MESHSQQNNSEAATNRSPSPAKQPTGNQVAASSDLSGKMSAKAVSEGSAQQKLKEESRQQKGAVPHKRKVRSQPVIKKTPANVHTSAAHGPKASRYKNELAPGERSLYVPVIIIALALLLIIGEQFFQELNKRLILQEQLEQQQSIFLKAKKVRLQLDSIANQTFQLSVKGNKNAARIVDKMKKAGFTFNQNRQ